MTLHINLTNRVIVKKNSRRIFRTNSGVINLPSASFEKFKNLSRPEVLNQALGVTFTQPVRIEYRFFLKGKLDSDIDNLIASINDVLVDCNVLADDRLVTHVEATKLLGCRTFETEIVIHGEL